LSPRYNDDNNYGGFQIVTGFEIRYAGDPFSGDVDSGLFRTPGSAAQTELRNLKLEQGKRFKYFFDYSDDLVHTVEVLDIHDPRDEDASYPPVVEKAGELPPQYGYVEERDPRESAVRPASCSAGTSKRENVI